MKTDSSLFHTFINAHEYNILKSYLDSYDWNVRKTAEKLGLQRSHLYNLIKKHNLKRPSKTL